MTRQLTDDEIDEVQYWSCIRGMVGSGWPPRKLATGVALGVLLGELDSPAQLCMAWRSDSEKVLERAIEAPAEFLAFTRRILEKVPPSDADAVVVANESKGIACAIAKPDFREVLRANVEAFVAFSEAEEPLS